MVFKFEFDLYRKFIEHYERYVLVHCYHLFQVKCWKHTKYCKTHAYTYMYTYLQNQNIRYLFKFSWSFSYDVMLMVLLWLFWHLGCHNGSRRGGARWWGGTRWADEEVQERAMEVDGADGNWLTEASGRSRGRRAWSGGGRGGMMTRVEARGGGWGGKLGGLTTSSGRHRRCRA